VSNFQVPSFGDPEAYRGWYAMLSLLDSVGRGNPVPAASPTIMLRPGEVQHGTLLVGIDIFCSADIEFSSGYSVSGGLLFSAIGMAVGEARLARERREAMMYSMPRWRHIGRMPLIVTNQRLLVMSDGQWATYALGGIIAMNPQIEHYLLDIHFESAYPLRFRGPWVPWLAVAISALVQPRPWPPPFVPARYLPATASLTRAPARELTAGPSVPDEAPELVARRIEGLPPAEAAEIIKRLDADMARRVLDLLDPHRSAEIRQHL
jgi:hypothetical protein